MNLNHLEYFIDSRLLLIISPVTSFILPHCVLLSRTVSQLSPFSARLPLRF